MQKLSWRLRNSGGYALVSAYALVGAYASFKKLASGAYLKRITFPRDLWQRGPIGPKK
jgi:hypothetical protein